MFRLAVPVVLAELGWMTMGMVDTLMVGRLGPEAIGAVGDRHLGLHGVRDLRHGPAARARHARVAGLRRRHDSTNATAGSLHGVRWRRADRTGHR